MSPVSPETVPLLAFSASILWFCSESLNSHYGDGDVFDMTHTFWVFFKCKAENGRSAHRVRQERRIKELVKQLNMKRSGSIVMQPHVKPSR